MNIAEKLQLIAENEAKVFNAGIEQGKKAEYDAFWDAFQNYGEPIDNLAYRFYKWEDAYYNPKHTFTIKEGYTINQMFYNTKITDTKVDINLSRGKSGSCHAVFSLSRDLRIIRKVIVNETITYTQWFDSCGALEDITFEGVIANDINFKYCEKLTFGSLINILRHLKDFTGTGEEYTRTLTLSQASVDILNEDTISWLGSLLSIEKKWSLTII